MVDDILGKKLGKYELVERVGRGGMAEVFKAYHASLDRHVAIKVLHPFLSEDVEFKARFEREAKHVARLNHSNIVKVYDFEFDEGRQLYYMVMEYVEGITLRNRLLELGTHGKLLPTDESLRIITELADALAYAHDRGMVHRDIKPANVIIEPEGRVVLTDFGIARILSGPNMTASGSMVGTPAYMAPEQGLGQPGDHRSDIYSLGVLLYQLVTGTVPFEADTPIAVVLMHVNETLPPPSERNPNLPEGVERVVYKALAKSPDNRYQNVREMVSHLTNVEAHTTLVLIEEEPKVKAEDESSTAVLPDLAHMQTGPITERELVESTAVSNRRMGCAGFVFAFLLSLASLAGGAYVAYTGLLFDYLPISGG